MAPDTWKGISGVTEVVLVRDSRIAHLPPPRSAGGRTVVIPLDLDDIRRCPRHHPSLVPNELALATLGNKRAFARYVAANGLSDLCPTSFWTEEEAAFPCVLKRTDLHAGMGVAVVRSREELRTFLEAETWKNKEIVMQAFVPGAAEYVTHCICRNGRILWHCTFRCEHDDAHHIRAGIAHHTFEPFDTSPETLARLERVLIPLRYDGPCNIDYKLSPKGDVSIFEANPRFGGSLMIPRHVGFLRQALGCLVKVALLNP